MITPRFLKAGDKIGIVAPGRKVSIEDLEAAMNFFSAWDLEVKLSNNLFKNDHSYLASKDESRLADFQEMINDPTISAIVCARGGYGSTRIIDQINFGPLLTHPKWIVGFSDITAIHLRLNLLGIESIHSTMPILFSKGDSASSIDSLKRVLFGTNSTISATANTSNIHGSATGRIIGGNLSLLVDSLSTLSDTTFDDKILIVEEIDEYLYKIDRMFTHLLRAGKLAKMRGLAVGHFSDIKDTSPGFGESVEQIVREKVKSFGYPLAFNLPVGHESPNLAWRSGSTMTLTVDRQGSRLEGLMV